MSNPKVSIIVPCYNYARFIPETLECLKKQTHTNWECIVVDDGSSDDSRAVVKPFVDQDARYKYIYQDNTGLPGARNTGIKNATGDFIQFLDSDDLLEPKKLELQLKAFQENPEADIVYSGLRYFQDGKPNELRYSMDWRNRPWTLNKSGKGSTLLKHFVTSCIIMPPMPLLRKEALEKTGLFKRDLRSCEDWEFWFRCARLDLNFVYQGAPETLSLMRMHDTSMTRNRVTMLSSIIEVRELMNESIDDPNLIKWNNKLILNDKLEMAVVKLQHESEESAISYLKNLKAEASSIRVKLFSWFIPKIKPSNSLFALSVVRTLMKRFSV